MKCDCFYCIKQILDSKRLNEIFSYAGRGSYPGLPVKIYDRNAIVSEKMSSYAGGFYPWGDRALFTVPELSSSPDGLILETPHLFVRSISIINPVNPPTVKDLDTFNYPDVKLDHIREEKYKGKLYKQRIYEVWGEQQRYYLGITITDEGKVNHITVFVYM